MKEHNEEKIEEIKEVLLINHISQDILRELLDKLGGNLKSTHLILNSLISCLGKVICKTVEKEMLKEALESICETLCSSVKENYDRINKEQE